MATEIYQAAGELRAKLRGYFVSLPFTWIDELVEILRNDWQDADTSPDEIEAGFREALHDALAGNVFPIETLWDTFDDSDESEISDS